MAPRIPRSHQDEIQPPVLEHQPPAIEEGEEDEQEEAAGVDAAGELPEGDEAVVVIPGADPVIGAVDDETEVGAGEEESDPEEDNRWCQSVQYSDEEGLYNQNDYEEELKERLNREGSYCKIKDLNDLLKAISNRYEYSDQWDYMIVSFRIDDAHMMLHKLKEGFRSQYWTWVGNMHRLEQLCNLIGALQDLSVKLGEVFELLQHEIFDRQLLSSLTYLLPTDRASDLQPPHIRLTVEEICGAINDMIAALPVEQTEDDNPLPAPIEEVKAAVPPPSLQMDFSSLSAHIKSLMESISSLCYKQWIRYPDDTTRYEIQPLAIEEGKEDEKQGSDFHAAVELPGGDEPVPSSPSSMPLSSS